MRTRTGFCLQGLKSHYLISKTPSDGHLYKKQELREPYLGDVQMQIHTVGHQDCITNTESCLGQCKKTMLWILYSGPPNFSQDPLYLWSAVITVLCVRRVRSDTKFQFYLYSLYRDSRCCISLTSSFSLKDPIGKLREIVSILRLRWWQREDSSIQNIKIALLQIEKHNCCFGPALHLLQVIHYSIENVPSGHGFWVNSESVVT